MSWADMTDAEFLDSAPTERRTLPVIDPFNDPGVWGVLDSACNSSWKILGPDLKNEFVLEPLFSPFVHVEHVCEG